MRVNIINWIEIRKPREDKTFNICVVCMKKMNLSQSALHIGNSWMHINCFEILVKKTRKVLKEIKPKLIAETI